MEALLLTKRIKLCEMAALLSERLPQLPALETHRCLQAIHAVHIQLPMPLKCKLLLRTCCERMESDVSSFMKVWCPWQASGQDEDDEGAEFDPMQPAISCLIKATG